MQHDNIDTLGGTGFTYMNGFGIQHSLVDVRLVAFTNERPTHVTCMPYSVAKSLQLALVEGLESYERRTGTSVPDLDQLGSALSEESTGDM